MGIAEVVPNILQHLSLFVIPMAVAHVEGSRYLLIGRQGEVGRHHIAISRHLATAALQLHRLDKQGYLGNLHGTLVQIYTIEIVLYDELWNITAAEVGTIVLHLIYIHVIEHGEGINKEVTTTAGRVDKFDIEHPILLRMAHLLLRRIGYQILGLAGFLINHEAAVRIHLQILLAQGIIYQELDYPLRGIDLTLEKNLIIFYFLATLLELHLFYCVEVLIHPTQYVIALPDVATALLVLLNVIESRDNLVQLIGSRHRGVRMICLVERNAILLKELLKLIGEEFLQTHALSRTLIGMLLQPHLVGVRQVAMFRTAANHLRKEFTVFHHLHSRQAVEEGEDTLFHGFQSRLVVVALHRHLVGSNDVFGSAKSRKAIFHSLLYEATYLKNMLYQFHCLYQFYL